MARRLIVLVGAVVMMAGLIAAPAGAHVNERVPAATETNFGTVTGFVGPTRLNVSDSTYETAHSGMQCGALSNPNMAPLPGPPDDPSITFECPSPNKSLR